MQISTDHFHPREILEGLQQRGFKTNMGYNNTGILATIWIQGGSFYYGMSQAAKSYTIIKDTNLY